VRAVVQALIIFPVAILLGVKFIANPFYIAAAFLILFLVSGGFAAISILVASIMKTRERFMGLGQALIMPLFFASNALYPIDAFPGFMRMLAQFNPLTHLVNGVRYFAVGRDFYAIGIHYVYSSTDIMHSFLALTGFAAIMFLVARRVFKNAVVT